jgi:hypothetical protein
MRRVVLGLVWVIGLALSGCQGPTWPDAWRCDAHGCHEEETP